MSETWAAIPGHAGYQASTDGRIRSVDRTIHYKDGRPSTRRGRILRPSVNTARGHYEMVGIAGTKYVHRLVLATFVGPCPPGMEGCHNDGNSLNNRLSNLRWDSVANNKLDTVRHGTHDRARRTHCPRLHPLTEPNLKPSWLRRGHRICLACGRASSRLSYLAARGVSADFQALADAYFAEIMKEAAA